MTTMLNSYQFCGIDINMGADQECRVNSKFNGAFDHIPNFHKIATSDVLYQDAKTDIDRDRAQSQIEGHDGRVGHIFHYGSGHMDKITRIQCSPEILYATVPGANH